MKNNIKKILIPFLSSLILILGIYFIGRLFFISANTEFFYFLKNTFGIQNINKDIIVLEIDDFTYNKLGFPLSREDYIPVLDNLSKVGVGVVGIDILFADKGRDNEIDNKLASKFEEVGNVVIGSDIIQNYSKEITPYNLFGEKISSIGYFTPVLNPYINKITGVEPYRLFSIGNDFYKRESFSFAILREYYNYIFGLDNNEIQDYQENFYSFFDKKIPINKITLKNSSSQSIEINEFSIYYESSSRFARERFYNVYTGNFDKNLFKDKIVLVGHTATGDDRDNYILPGYGITKGVYIHANAINNILNSNYIVYFNKKLEIFISFIFISFIIYLNLYHLKNARFKWMLIGSLSLFFIVFSLYLISFLILYKNSQIFFVPNYPIEFGVLLFISFFVSLLLKYKTEDKNKRLLSKALGEYVSSDIVGEILNSKGNINLSGENKCITIFFSDIAGFTTISEKLSPEELVAFLRVYLGEMSNIIMDNKGFINKYEGDAIMALWGIFGKVEKFGVKEALVSALLQQSKLKVLNDIWASENKNQLSVRMGIHTGNAIIGNIGAEGRKMEYTALGDSVNLASRLEGVNKFYNTNICVSEDVVKNAGNDFVFRYLDKIRVKGKNIGVNIYELMGFKEGISNLKLEIKDKFEKAISIYLERDFKGAFDVFDYLESIGDKTSSVYKYRCNMYLANPPGEDWDGIWVLDEK